MTNSTASRAAPPASGVSTRARSVLGCTVADLEAFCAAHGQPAFRARQVYSWVFAQRVNSFVAMSNVPHALRSKLQDHFDLQRPQIDGCQASHDGTRKYRFLGHDGASFEAVYIPEVARGASTNTLCISSQTGCAVGCKFCFTASLRRNRNLGTGEIVGQVLAVRDDLAALSDHASVTNVVFMGMGEPLLNYDNVVRATRILLDPLGAGFSSRRITISTSGIVPRISQLGRDLPVQLAVSLNASSDAVRSQIMPINKKWPIEKLCEALRSYPLRPRRRITIEYVLLGGINDSEEDARRMPDLLRDIPVKINLLPLNPHDRTPFTPPAPERVHAFQRELVRAGFNVLVRTPRGQDIAAACGQLGESSLSGGPPHLTSRQ